MYTSSMPKTLYIKHESGALHTLTGRRLARLLSELKAGRGGAEISSLLEDGYIGFLDDAGAISDFEALS